MKINCIAIDDESPALEQMRDYIYKVPFLELKGLFDNAIEALEFLKQTEIDLIFLDIEMEDITGIQFLKVLKRKPKVIFTTAYHQYAIQAFDLDVSDYLLKPIAFDRFLLAADKVFDSVCINNNSIPVKNQQDKSFTRNYIFVKTEYRMQRIDYADILYIEGMSDYLAIYTSKGKVLTLVSFKKIEEQLQSSEFARVHKSYIVALSKIESIEKNRIKINNKYIPISETYRKSFYELLKSI